MRYMDNDAQLLSEDYIKKNTGSGRVLKMNDIKAAKELCYPQKVVRMLENTDNPYKRQQILINARKGYYDE